MKVNFKWIAAVCLITLASCGGGKTKAAKTQVSPDSPGANPSPTSTPPPITSFEAYAGSSTLGHGESTSITVVGGNGNYSFSVQSGTGTITATGYYTAPNTDSTETILVRDLSNNKTATVTIEVSDISIAIGCTQLGTVGTGAQQSGIEKSIDLTKYSYLNGYVIVGVGLRILNSNVEAIYAKLAKFKASGETDQSDTYIYRTGTFGSSSSENKGELYIEMPPNFYVYGVGIAVESTGQDLEILKLYGARVDGSTGSVSNEMTCFLRRNGSKGCSSSLTITNPSGYREHQGQASRPLVAFGFGVTTNSVSAVSAKYRNLDFKQSGGCSN